MSFSGGFTSVFSSGITSFQYRDLAAADGQTAGGVATAMEDEPRQVLLTEQELADRLELARAEGAASAENRLRHDLDVRARAEAAKIVSAVECFERERKEYFARVESEVVGLALSIAAKILHREAQVDPTLVAALVQIAIAQLRDGSTVSLRVRPEEAARWRAHLAATAQKVSLSIVEDAELGLDDCILETELGSANFSIAAQLKEVEQGFFDVLAQRPPSR
jgi:flagellar assembly protein FliH